MIIFEVKKKQLSHFTNISFIRFHIGCYVSVYKFCIFRPFTAIKGLTEIRWLSNLLV